MSDPAAAPDYAARSTATGPMTRTTAAWLAALLGWTLFLGSYDLRGGAGFEPIDAWVGQTAREMADAGRWLVPQFAGETRMQKSPGPYWAVIATGMVRGRPIDTISARIPNVILSALLVLTIFWLTRRVAGDRAAVFAGFAASSSALILWWSHRAASDIGLTAWTTLSLACLWVALECEPRGPKRTLLLLTGYLAAGVGMLWKMPMPLVVVGIPAVLHLIVHRRWSLLADRWHLAGLVLFALPWLPWALAVLLHEPNALQKWRVEFVDRYTGDLPNYAQQSYVGSFLLYFTPMLVYTLPYTLSLPAAISWAFRRREGLDQRAARFMLLWVGGLLVFFTASAGKEERYFLPAIPPLFVLLGVELSSLFDPARPRRVALVRLVTWKVWVVLPIALAVGGYFGLTTWWAQRGQYELAGWLDWDDVWPAFAVGGVLLYAGLAGAAWLYARGRISESFAALVVTMYVCWLWAWPKMVPLMLSQRPFIEFAQRLADPHVVPPGQRALLRNVGTHEPRVIWYSDLRFPRLIDQLELLAEQSGRRSLDYEKRRYGEEIVRRLESDEPVLLVASLADFWTLLTEAPPQLEAAGRPLPPLHLWIQSRYGRLDQQMVLFGNRPPAHGEPPLVLPEKQRRRLASLGSRWPLAVAPPPGEAAETPAEGAAPPVGEEAGP